MTDETDRPITRAELEAWREGVSREIRGGGSREGGGGGSPSPPAPSDSAPRGAEDESPALRTARALRAQRERDAEVLDLARIAAEASGNYDRSVIEGMTPEELRVAAGFDDPAILNPDAHADDPRANIGPATRIPGSGGLMDAEELQRRREAAETTVPEEVLEYRRRRGLA